MPQVDDVALTRRRQQVLAHIRATTADHLGRRWLSLGSYRESEQRRWEALARPVVAAGQGRAIDIQVAHLQALLGDVVEFDRDAILELAQVDLTEPFIALARSLAGGEKLALAIEAGFLRAQGLGESSVQWAARAANSAVESDERIVGWTRTLTGLACEWCRTVATQRYRSAESASFGHQRCDCGVDPIIGDRDPGRRINSQLLEDLG